MRAAIDAVKAQVAVTFVDDTGLIAYSNSSQGREELDLTPHGRMATSLARRLQDLAHEVLKLESRHFHLGFEQSLLTKAALKRAMRETIQSSVSHLGADLRRTNASYLALVPGLKEESAKALLEAAERGDVTSRVWVASSGLLDDVAYRNAAAFVRIPDSAEPLDRSSLHPEQYELTRRVIDATGRSFDEVYTRSGSLKNLNPGDFGIDKFAWRDLTREVGFPGRDPRPRIWPPKLLPADTDPSTLEKGQVLEGFVTGLQSFQAMIDVGLEREVSLHVSEISRHYARDARELLSIGQPVRVVVVELSGSRIGVSMKSAPDRERPPRGEGRGRGRRNEQRSDTAWPQPQRMSRVAATRRDGMPGQEERGGRRGRGGPGGGGGRGGGFQGGGGRGRDGGRGRGGRRDEAAFGGLERAKTSKQPSYNPFANFFKDRQDGEGAADQSAAPEE